MKNVFCLMIFVLCFNSNIYSADWPQFRGLHRDGIASEIGLLKQWPEGGPKLLWSFEDLGAGYGSAAIAAGSVYIVGEENNLETVFAFDLQGKLLWKTAVSKRWNQSFPEARTTPTVENGFLYVSTGLGDIACLNAKTGKVKWNVQAVEKFSGKYHRWGIAECPLVVDDKVIATPGGKDATLVALDKSSGKTVWTTKGLDEQANYCSPILVERAGLKIIVTMLEKHFVGINAADGRLLWKDAFTDYQGTAKDINPVSPVYLDGFIYTTSGYDDGGAMYQLAEDGLSITRVWTDKTLDVHIGGVVLVNGVIYGSSWEGNGDGSWVALDWKTGKVLYEHKWINKGAIIFADGLLYLYAEKQGLVGLVRPNPEQFELISFFPITLGAGPHWAHPSLADGRLYIRHGNALMVYDVKAK